MSWKRFTEQRFYFSELNVSLDLSRLEIPDSFYQKMNSPLKKAFTAMDQLERGSMANPDEERMVGHYWLRNAALAPDTSLRNEIQDTRNRILDLAAKVHSGEIRGAHGPFSNILVIGIGGSALGPQFVSQALGHPTEDKLKAYFLDNTDPDGMDMVFAQLEGHFGRTLAIVISKSGGTPETRNGMIEAKAVYERAGLEFSKHAIAITGSGSKLDSVARSEGWLATFPMWDWVGGRTSETGPVGLVPAALQGINIEGILAGASAMDSATRFPERDKNPAALLALAWHHATDGRGAKDMVILPYKDRLLLFSRYLQQLIMESLGKETDLDGKTVNQGIAVYGNKGSTDQHAYVQQLRDGVNNFFITFIQVLRDRNTPHIEVENGFTSGDFLQGFLLGTRDALSEKQRGSVTITIPEVSPRTVGMLIALYERAVGFYATLININAYHQPGVEAGKKAATSALALKAKVLKALRDASSRAFTAEQLAAEIEETEQTERIFLLLEHLAANPEKGISRTPADRWFEASFKAD